MQKEMIKNKLKDYIVNEFHINASEYDIENIDLFEEGIINSFGFIKYISFIEDEFRVSFNESCLYDERFLSINGQAELITDLIKNT